MNYPWIEKANRIFSAVLIGQFIITLIIAFFTDTWFEGIAIGLLIVALPLFLINTAPFASVTRHAVGIAVQLFAALHIQQAMGLTELHFEIFVMLAFLSFLPRLAGDFVQRIIYSRSSYSVFYCAVARRLDLHI